LDGSSATSPALTPLDGPQRYSVSLGPCPPRAIQSIGATCPFTEQMSCVHVPATAGLVADADAPHRRSPSPAIVTTVTAGRRARIISPTIDSVRGARQRSWLGNAALSPRSTAQAPGHAGRRTLPLLDDRRSLDWTRSGERGDHNGQGRAHRFPGDRLRCCTVERPSVAPRVRGGHR
jgi:hypothetical protein